MKFKESVMKHYKTKPNKSSVVKHLQSTRKLLISMNYFLYIYFTWNICLIYENLAIYKFYKWSKKYFLPRNIFKNYDKG